MVSNTLAAINIVLSELTVFVAVLVPLVFTCAKYTFNGGCIAFGWAVEPKVI